MGIASKIFAEAFGCQNVVQEARFSESIMDYANGSSLCEEIWDKTDSGYVLKPEVKEKALELAKWAIDKYGLKNPTVRLIGSICSNAFTDDSDLDIHITDTSLTLEDREKINDNLGNEFKSTFEENDQDKFLSHPFELYVQENEFRDLLSVGCYNLENDEWESGPTFYPNDYDPFGEYYEKIYSTHGELIGEIRDYIMSVLEYVYTAGISLEKSNESFKELFGDLSSEIVENAKALLKESRDMRGSLTEPKSKEEAFATKEREEWKVADATFKLLGKFGYISVLKKISKLDQNSQLDEFCSNLSEICEKRLFSKKDTTDEKISVQDKG